MTCPVVDQAVLHGLIKKVRDLSEPLVSVSPVEPVEAGGLDDRWQGEASGLSRQRRGE